MKENVKTGITKTQKELLRTRNNATSSGASHSIPSWGY